MKTVSDTRALVAAMIAVVSIPRAGGASPADHLQCFKIKDSVAKATYTADVTPGDSRFPAANGCIVRTPAKMLCVDAVKSNVAPVPPGAPDGSPAQEYLCYKTKCPKVTPTATLTDQFGTHTVLVKAPGLLCAPVAGSTTVTTIPTTTTTLPATCDPSSSCPGGPACINLADNAGLDVFALRVAQLTLSKPGPLAAGLLGSLIDGATLMREPACNLNGQGTFSWLLRFDTTAGTLQMGGARPVVDPTLGYVITNPVTTPLVLASNGSFSADPVDVSLPVYLDQTGAFVFSLPLRRATLVGQLSPDRSCIGTYNASELVPPECAPDASTRSFLDGGTVHAHVSLEDADASIVPPLNQSLCVVLSGDASTYGDGGNPTRCRRSGGVIAFHGDYCSITNAPGGCADSVEVQGNFAASGVTISGTETVPTTTTSTTLPCGPGETFCSNLYCANVANDVTDCGTCGNVCVLPNATPLCATGKCMVDSCNAGYGDCDGMPATGCETKVASDPANCGTCGHACAAGQTCSGGACS